MTEGDVLKLYRKEVFGIIDEIYDTEEKNILKAARMVADHVKKDRARALPPAPTPRAPLLVVEGGGGLAPRFPAGPAWPHLRCRPCPGLNICHSWITATMNPGRARTALARPISSPIVITITSSLFSC